MKPTYMKLTTLKGVAHLWRDTSTTSGAPIWTSACGRIEHYDYLDPPTDGDRKCQRCFPQRNEERD